MTLQAAFAATLVDEWVRAGVAAAVLSPGSRSAPLARALLDDARIAVHVRLDERSAAYFALGLSISSGRPSLVLTTSGTAAAELHPAVVEADLAGVPLICCTADRPPELHGVGAPQTVEQAGLFASAVRFSCCPGPPGEDGRPSWRSLAARLVGEAESGPAGPGPVHLNLAFREPLVTEAGDLPAGRPAGAPWHEVVTGPAAPAAAVERLLAACEGRRGILIAGSGAGGGSPSARRVLLGLAGALGWPLLDDGRAWRREPGGPGEVVVAAADHVLRSAGARRALVPEVVLRLGSPPASKVLGGWLAGLPGSTLQLLVDPYGRWQEPERSAAVVLRADPAALAAVAIERLAGLPPAAARQARGRGDADTWADTWVACEERAQGAFEAILGGEERLSEPGLARALVAGAPAGAALFASSSMPVRDLEWFGRPRPGAPLVLANRGANGIDGVVSTLLGAAAERAVAGRGPTIGLVGDLALLHDLSALVWGTAAAPPPCRLVVVDNAGGGIFSFLPYAGSLGGDLFERAFATPQRPDPAEVAAALGHPVVEISRAGELAAALATAPRSLEVLVLRSDRDANLAVHRRLEEAVVAAVGELLA